MKAPVTPRRPGDREWTQEQRAERSRWLKNINALQKQIQAIEREKDPENCIKNMTLGRLQKVIDDLKSAGATDKSPITFHPTVSGDDGIEVLLAARTTKGKVTPRVTFR